MPMKSLLSVLTVSAIALAAGAAKADVAFYTSQSAYVTGAAAQSNGTTSAMADSVDWGIFSQNLGNSSINNSSVNNGAYIITPQNEKVTVNASNASQFLVYTNGLTTGAPATRWDGDFANGSNILYTSGAALTISFGSAITGIGFDLQTKIAGAYGFTIQAYNAANFLIGTATNSGSSTGSNSSNFNTAAFAGITDSSGSISYVVITDTGLNTGNGFAIDTSLVYHYPVVASGGGTATTPEPGTLGLLGAGLVGLGYVRRRQQRKAA